MLLSNGVFRQQIIFSPEDTDAFGRVDGRAILIRFQNIAGDHFDTLEAGLTSAAENGCFWATARTTVEIIFPPLTGEELTLDTWPGKQSHGIYMRHYLLQDAAGRDLLRGVSAWVLMDVETRALAANRDWIRNLGVISQPGEMSGTQRLRLHAQLPENTCRTVTAAETDVNGHMNNAEYYRWGADLLPADYAAGHRLRQLGIDYRKEMVQGQTAQLHWQLAEDILSLRGTVDGKETFTLRCEYDPI